MAGITRDAVRRALDWAWERAAQGLPGQKTATSPKGRDCAATGIPIKVPELIAYSFTPAYIARGAVTTPAAAA